tara:strand:- start:923 stop:1381 length:459 start_codon:yes stop_codon:yes gene_type:complete
MIKIDVFVKDKNWKNYISDPNKYLNKLAKRINLNFIAKSKSINFSIRLTGNKEIKILNKKFRKKNKTTDVLSFPYYIPSETKDKLKINKKIYLGDIVINLYKIDKTKNKFEKEFNKLWVHGLVHLLGHKHYKNKDFFKMMKIENKIIKQLKC